MEIEQTVMDTWVGTGMGRTLKREEKCEQNRDYGEGELKLIGH